MQVMWVNGLNKYFQKIRRLNGALQRLLFSHSSALLALDSTKTQNSNNHDGNLLSLGVTILQQLWWINISLTSNTASSPNVITRSTRSTTADSMLVRFVFPHHHVQHSDQIMICLPILTSPLLPNYHPITHVGDVISNETGKFYEWHHHTGASHVHASCFCHAPHTPGKMTQYPSIIEC